MLGAGGEGDPGRAAPRPGRAGSGPGSRGRRRVPTPHQRASEASELGQAPGEPVREEAAARRCDRRKPSTRCGARPPPFHGSARPVRRSRPAAAHERGRAAGSLLAVLTWQAEPHVPRLVCAVRGIPNRPQQGPELRIRGPASPGRAHPHGAGRPGRRKRHSRPCAGAGRSGPRPPCSPGCRSLPPSATTRVSAPFPAPSRAVPRPSEFTAVRPC